MILIAIFGITDKTIFLATRGEHYWVVLVGFTFPAAGDLWISSSKVVWCAIWFWAATSKINHHFPSVIMFMVKNGPLAPKWFKKLLFRDYIDDLRPSKFASFLAHFGTCTEYMIPVILMSNDGGIGTVLGLTLMTCFHGFIGGNNPSGMPVEWNILMIYGGIFLFGANAGVGITELSASPLLVVFLFTSTTLIPTLGNFFPAYFSFLRSMRYYAGNWAYNIWLIRPEAIHKLDRLKKSAGTMRQQLESIQPQCEFEEGEVRVVMVESQPLFGPTMSWKVVDAKTGVVVRGETNIASMLDVTPYPTGKYAEAFGKSSSSS